MEENWTFEDFLKELNDALENWDQEGGFGEYIDSLYFVAQMGVYLPEEAHQKAANTALKRIKGMARGKAKSDGSPGQIVKIAQKMLGSFSSKGKKKKKEKPVDIVYIADASNAYETLCRYDAVYDLLTCNLHRLDPVIGDYGCQWRVPFILDLYDHVRAQLLGDVIDNEDALQQALEMYATYRERFPSYDEISEIFKEPNRHRSDNFQDTAVLKFMSDVVGFQDGLPENCSGFEAIINWFATVLVNGWGGLPGTFNAYEYLMLCKLFTIKRIRMTDSFGLSARFNLERNIPHSNSILRTGIEQLAIYSKIYMAHVTQSVCHSLDIDIDGETGLAVLEEGEPVHIAASCSDLMQIGRYQTSFNGQAFETHLFYGPFRSIFMHQHTKNQPIIVDIRRLVCRNNPDGNVEDGTDLTYTLNGGAILYFEPDEDGFGFNYVPNPTQEQMNTVGMCVEGFSILNLAADQVVTDEDAVFYTEDFSEYINLVTNECQIFDLIMVGGACHDETPPSHLYLADDGDMPLNTIKEYKEQVEQNYHNSFPGVSLYDGIPLDIPLTSRSIPFIAHSETPGWDIITERRALQALAWKFRMESVSYVNNRSGLEGKFRNTATVPFAPIHIYGCTYAIKVQELNEMLAENDNNAIETAWVIDKNACKKKKE